MHSNRGLLLSLFFSASALLLVACGPTYPNCENDEHCAEKGEFCVNKTCTQCRDNSQCSGAGQVCSSGRCVTKVGYCDDTVACPSSQKCRDNECGAQCLDNSECSGNTYCSSGSCIAKPQCGPNSDTPACPGDQQCIAGQCQVQLTSCRADAIHFAFDRSSVRRNQRSKLDGIASCLGGANAANTQLQGHADERGTEEYNLALGEARAEAVKRYLKNKGVPSNKMTVTSFGEERPAARGSNERAWSKNRRVEFGQ